MCTAAPLIYALNCGLGDTTESKIKGRGLSEDVFKIKCKQTREEDAQRCGKAH